MNSLGRRFLAMSVGVLVIATVLLVAGAQGSLLLGFAPLVACVGVHVLMGHGDHHGGPQQVGRPGRE